jgi:hypothetical protein
MNHTCLRLAVALGALVLVGRGDAQSSSQKPMLQVTIKSMKDVLTKIKDLTKSTMETLGQSAMWPMIEAGLDSKLGKGGEKIAGLDPSKPIGLRIMYKPPTGPVPIDGDILLMLPTNDAGKLMKEGLPTLGLTAPAAGDGGLTTLTIGGAKAFARESNGYVCVTVADADVVSQARLPKPNDVFGDVKHDVTLTLGVGVLPEATIRNGIKTLQSLQPAAASAADEKKTQNLVDTEVIQFGLDVDSSTGKLLLDSSISAKPGTALSTIFKGSTPGPLKSAIGLSPTAVFSLAVRGDFVAQGGMFSDAGKLKGAPPIIPKVALDSAIEIFEELAKQELEDMTLSISGDGTAILAAAVKSTAAFELKIGEVIDKAVPAIQKEAGDNADKVKEMSKKDAVTIGGVKLSRIWIPLSKKSRDWGFSIFMGVKDNVAFVAGTMLDSTETIEHALQQKVIEDHDPYKATLKLKELAEAFLILDYKGSAAVKVESKGGNPFKFAIEIPVKDIAELFKLGLAEKIKQRFGSAKPGDDDGG